MSSAMSTKRISAILPKTSLTLPWYILKVYLQEQLESISLQIVLALNMALEANGADMLLNLGDYGEEISRNMKRMNITGASGNYN